MGKSIASAFAKGAALAGAVACAGVALAAPRADETVDVRWRQVAHHRYAHRGMHDRFADIPENSIAAFLRARNLGFGAELDVHLTADGGLVVIHDSDVSRMCGCAGIVEEMTADEACALHLAGTDQRIPTLEAVLRVFEWDAADGEAMPAPLVIELKTRGDNAAELCERTMAVLDAHNVRYVIESFDPRVPLWLRRYRPDVVRGLLTENFPADGATAPYGRVARKTMALGAGNVLAKPDFVSCRFVDRDMPAVRLMCDALGARLMTWTIRSTSDMLRSEAEDAPVIFEGFVPGPRSTVAREEAR